MAKFEIAFVDGTKVIKEASTADEAKAMAKHERRAPMPRDTPGSAPEVKVTSVTRLQEESRDRRNPPRTASATATATVRSSGAQLGTQP